MQTKFFKLFIFFITSLVIFANNINCAEAKSKPVKEVTFNIIVSTKSLRYLYGTYNGKSLLINVKCPENLTIEQVLEKYVRSNKEFSTWEEQYLKLDKCYELFDEEINEVLQMPISIVIKYLVDQLPIIAYKNSH